MKFLKEKVLPVLVVLAFIAIFWVWPEVNKYQWADKQKAYIAKEFPPERFRLFETLNNRIDPIEFWTWFNPPIHTLQYLDAESMVSFSKDWDNTPSCFIGGKCPAWTAYRTMSVYRNEHADTMIADSVKIIDCETGNGGFYHIEKKAFYFWEKDERYNIQPSKEEHQFVCSQPEGAYLKDINLETLESNLATWEPLEEKI